MDLDMDTDLDLGDLVASPPSPTLDVLQITSRAAVRALLNPAPTSVLTFAPAQQAAAVSDEDVLPQLDVPVDDETETQVEVEVGGEETDGKMEVVILLVLVGDVIPLVLPELDASEELVLAAGGGGDTGVPSDDADANTFDVGEEAMATKIWAQIANQGYLVDYAKCRRLSFETNTKHQEWLGWPTLEFNFDERMPAGGPDVEAAVVVVMG